MAGEKPWIDVYVEVVIMKYVTTVNNQQYTIDIDHAGEIIVNGQVINVDMLQMQDTTTYSMIINGES